MLLAVIRQYRLTAISNGLLLPSSDWYDSGATITELATIPTSNESGIRNVCIGWCGEGSLPISGKESAIKFAINEPSSITWNWKIQFLISLTVNPLTVGITNPFGENLWVDAGKLLVSVSPNSDYSFSYWSANSEEIIIERPNEASSAVTINGPGTITARLTNTTTLKSANSIPADSKYPADPTSIPSAAKTPESDKTSSPSTSPTDSHRQKPYPFPNKFASSR